MSSPSNFREPDRFDAFYFSRWNYADRRLGPFSMYWFARRYYAALILRHAPGAGGALLELGCGLGHLLGLLQDHFRCVGADVSHHAVTHTRAHAPRAQVVQMDAAHLGGFRDGTFQVVAALHVVEHLPNPADTLAAICRILVPGGLLLFATPNPDYALRWWKDPATDAIGKDPTHINVQPPARWRGWCDDAGLTMIRHFGDGLWDTPYLPWIPVMVQRAVFGLPAALQVLTRSTFTPLSLGVNQVCLARKPARDAVTPSRHGPPPPARTMS